VQLTLEEVEIVYLVRVKERGFDNVPRVHFMTGIQGHGV
jgi:hypothetical protein